MDIVSDALIRLKNSYIVGKQKCDLRYSKLVMEICRILKENGYIGAYKQNGFAIEVELKYNHKNAAIVGIKRISKPGLRIYKGSKKLQYVLNGLGLLIVSTPKGVMSGKDARKQGLGGEVLAEVW